MQDACLVSQKLVPISLRCQGYSTEGLGLGLKDERSKPLDYILRYIEDRMPPIVVLENVEGLVARHGKVLEQAPKNAASLND